MGKGSVLVLVIALGFGCSAELPAPASDARASLSFEPEVPADAVPPTVRLHVSGPFASPAALRLFRDELSDYHIGRIRSGDLPQTLLEREVVTLAYGSAKECTVVPTQELAPGVYSLASAELGLIGAFAVSRKAARPTFQRLWPVGDRAGVWAAYCGDAAPPLSQALVLDPSGVGATLAPGLAASGLLADRCVSIELDQSLDADSMALPPVDVGSVTFEQRALLGPAPEASPSSACGEVEMALGVGCAAVGDDRLLLRADHPLLWLFRAPAAAVVVSARGEQRAVGGLVPSSTVRVAGEVIDESGARYPFDEQVTTLAATARVVINEVLANAAGPEPAAEWVELYNDGSAELNLAGYRLRDGGGEVTLPEAVLAPHAYALLVREDFAANSTADVPPAPDTTLVALPTLAKNGLSNSGETLELLDAQGLCVSLFPALPSNDAGVSLARRTPAAPDDDPSAFAVHAAPGASPGAPNELAQ